MNKHTQGPWTIGFQNNQTVYSGSKEIATMACKQKEWEANARLIAAAPDLLRALQHAHVRALKARSYGVDMLSSKNLCLDDVISIVTEAIAKAEGL